MTITELLDRFEGVRRSGGGWVARCPGHDDKVQSLSVKEGDDGRILLRCFAGCAVDTIVSELGLDVRDLFAERERVVVAAPASRNGHRRPSADEHARYRTALLENPNTLDRLRELKGYTPDALDRLQVGLDADRLVIPMFNGGDLVGYVRYAPNKERRTGPKMKADAGVPRALFPSELPDGDLFLCEGEPDAIALASVGIASVAVPGVASWKTAWAHQFTGRTVTVVFDCDEPGRKAAQRVASDLHAAGVRVRVLELGEDRDDGYDVGDIVKAAQTDTERNAARSLLLQLADAAPLWQPTEKPPTHISGKVSTPLPAAKPLIEWQRGSQVEMRSVVFVAKPLLIRDTFHMLVGRKAQGKGTLMSLIAARVTRGDYGPKRNVIWIGSEDSAAIDIIPRIVAAGGDPHRVLLIKNGWLQLPRDLDEIRRAITDMGDVGLVLIDPIGNHIAGKNSNAETDIRDAIGPLNEIADTYQTMVFGIRHLTEKEARGGVIAAIIGSSAFVQVPRAVLAIVADETDPSLAHVQCVTGNRLPKNTPGRLFRIEAVNVAGLDTPVTRAVEVGDSGKSVDDLLSAEKPPSKSSTARELILDILDAEGEQESDALDARVARETGLAVGTVKNCKTKLKEDGLIRFRPEKDAAGKIQDWFVKRTSAPRARDLEKPLHDSKPDATKTAQQSQITPTSLDTESSDLDCLRQSQITGLRQQDLDRSRDVAAMTRRTPTTPARAPKAAPPTPLTPPCTP